jgi:transcriptional regulator
MYSPPAFRDTDLAILHDLIRSTPVANLVTSTAEGLVATPLPLFLAPEEGAHGTLYGHVAKANPQWRAPPTADALAIFMGPDAYISPSWYANKPIDGKVVPTYNYATVHAYGPAEFFDDADRLLAIVTRLTDKFERARAQPWKVTDAPSAFIEAQLRGIVGVRLPISRLEGKRKLSQNRPAEDRVRVVGELAASNRPADRAVAAMTPLPPLPNK